MDARGSIFSNDYSIGITDNKIASIGKRSKLKEEGAQITLDATGKIIIPGMVNTHTHLFQTLCKGLGHDKSLFDWFRTAILPYAQLLSEDDCYWAAMLGCLEATKSGVTCLNDFMYVHPRPKLSDSVIRAMVDSGIRGIYSRGIVDAGKDHGMPDVLIEDLDDSIEDSERVFSAYQNTADGRISVWTAPASLWMSTPKAFRKAKEFSDNHSTWLTWHSSETRGVVNYCKSQYGKSDMSLLHDSKLLGERTLAAHCVWLSDSEIQQMKEDGSSVAHCPVANMYLSDGIARVPDMLRNGINVGLGTDGSASNDNQDVISLLKTAALLHKVSAPDPTIITAKEVLNMATIGGARSLGLGEQIGSIEIGKKADITILDFNKPNTTPMHEPISSLVYCATQENVDAVIVDGRILMEGRKMKNVDEALIMQKVVTIVESLRSRSTVG
jgi:5-methylthioadenosine/S-adenosylhomocysteine deaminase